MKVNKLLAAVLIFATLLLVGIVMYAVLTLGPTPVVVPEPEATEPPMTVYIPMIEQPEVVRKVPEMEPLIYIPDQVILHELDQRDVKILARLLWSSPLRDEQEKRKLLWVVFNRMDDDSGIFGGTIQSVVIRREFAFYDSNCYISKVNIQIATEELNKYLSLHQGYHITRPIPADHLYCDFAGYAIRTYSTINH